MTDATPIAHRPHPVGRRAALTGAASLAIAAGAFPAPFVRAQGARIKIGLMLPYSGNFALLGNNITDAFKLAIAERGGKLGGRDVQFVQIDDESDPAKAPQNANRLVVGEKVDVLVGTVSSAVQAAMIRVAREEGTYLLIPNAGLNAGSRELCAPNIFRTSFSNWQPAYPMGKVMYDRGHRNVVTYAWKYAAGDESVGGFIEGFTQAGGKIVKELSLPFPDVEFQAQLTEIASLKPDAVFVFFAGAGAGKFVKDYDAAGLRRTIPLYGTGFLTDGVLEAQGAAAEGLMTTLHYVEDLDNAANKRFKDAFKAASKREADVYAVQGYDTGLLLAQALDAVKGDIGARAELIKATRAAKIDSPRGPWTFSASQNPVQDIYLREVRRGENRFVSVAHKALADPGTGCRMPT
jgi:branched-chain amino acid transport system substrate-binding protein